MTTYIADVGSCHLCNKSRALDLINLCASVGVGACKFQLFGDREAKAGNIKLPREWWPDLMDRADAQDITLFASVWASEDIALLAEHEVPWIKFAYSQRESDLIPKCYELFERVYVTCDFLDFDLPTNPKLIRLWVDSCHGEALYPSTNEPDWAGIERGWQGASIHSLSPTSICKASWAGLKHIEFHMRYGDELDGLTPDGRFAFSPTQISTVLESL